MSQQSLNTHSCEKHVSNTEVCWDNSVPLQSKLKDCWDKSVPLQKKPKNLKEKPGKTPTNFTKKWKCMSLENIKAFFLQYSLS